jgi:hypothetical protein
VSGRASWVSRAAALVWLASAGVGAAAEPFVVGIGRSINDPPQATAAMSELGVRSMRVDAPWASIETAPGRYRVPDWLEEAVDSARARGIEPLLILAYGHPLHGADKPRSDSAREAFARYAAFLVRHFEGRVRWYDLWNEWDAHTGRTTPGTADDYVALARLVYPAVKRSDRRAMLLSGGLTPYGIERGFMERFIELGGLPYVDGVSLHPYNFLERTANTPEDAIAELDRIHAMTVAAGQERPIFVTEMGYPAFAGRGGVDRRTAAEYLSRFMLLAAARPHVAGVWWYCLRDQGTDPANDRHAFGVYDAAWRLKPAGRALRAVAAVLAERERRVAWR